MEDYWEGYSDADFLLVKEGKVRNNANTTPTWSLTLKHSGKKCVKQSDITSQASHLLSTAMTKISDEL